MSRTLSRITCITVASVLVALFAAQQSRRIAIGYARSLASIPKSAIQQNAARPFTVEQILGFPSPENLIASPTGSTIAWTFNERGVRNIYVADGPGFEARRITAYTEDDGQELTQLSFSRDGRTIVYVRGGDHGGRPSDVAPNPAGDPVQPKDSSVVGFAGRGSSQTHRRG